MISEPISRKKIKDKEMKIDFSPPDITELEVESVAAALRSGWITTGPRTKEFERLIAKYCGTEKAVCLNSATACLELTLRILGIGEGDEVITSAYTYTASASVIAHVGAKIVLVDVAMGSYEMDYDQLASAITDRTKAIIPVDLGGVPCDYDKIFEVVESKKSLFVHDNDLQKALGRVAIIADCAHSYGAKYKGKTAGSVADFTSFSFHAVKNLTTAEGGALVWNNIDGVDNEKLYKQFMLWSLHGQSKDALAKTKIGCWEYDIELLGHKCNMTDIVAAVGCVQLDRYPQILNRRKQIIQIYDKVLKSCDIEILQHYNDDYTSSGHLYLTRINGASASTRNKVIEQMAEKGIATNVHYKPLPLHTAYRNLGLDIRDFPNALAQFENEITLPLHTLLSDEQAEYVAESYKELLGQLR